MKRYLSTIPTALVLLAITAPAFAVDGEMSPKGYIGLGAGITMGFAVAGGALAQGMAARGALEGIARNPNAQGKVLVPMVLGLALIESLVILAFLVAQSLVAAAS